MKNMHVLYECYDARDDYATERRAGLEVGVNDYLGRGQENEGENDVRVADDCAVDYTEDTLSSLLDDGEVLEIKNQRRGQLIWRYNMSLLIPIHAMLGVCNK